MEKLLDKFFHKPTAGKAFTRWWILNTKYLRIAVHKIAEPVDIPHDHPWHMLILIMKGGYRELTEKAFKKLTAPSIRWVSSKTIHTIPEVFETTWTLVFMIGERGTWQEYADHEGNT